ncbi:MAG: hypothetical protein JO079_00735 [Frankiaceae bacterium]|nr:hypothetical protein [Frankiaceae bacterium]MBV9369449.1 hypothetical protein [Frankiales bacterium]
MTVMPTASDYADLRRHVRGSQHARSFPLLVIGGLLVNYAVTNFQSSPVDWRYGAPLAFVLIWALGKINEQARGVGAPRGDYLVAAGAVFIATNSLLLFTRFAADFRGLVGAWVIIVGVALVVLSRASRDAVLLAAGLTVVAAGAVVAEAGTVYFGSSIQGWTFFARGWSILLIAAVGTLLGLTGLLLYRSERAEP